MNFLACSSGLQHLRSGMVKSMFPQPLDIYIKIRSGQLTFVVQIPDMFPRK